MVKKNCEIRCKLISSLIKIYKSNLNNDHLSEYTFSAISKAMFNSTDLYIVPPSQNLSYYINISGYGCNYLTQPCITVNSLSWTKTVLNLTTNYNYVNYSSVPTGLRQANVTSNIDWSENNTRYLIQVNSSLNANFPEFCVDLGSQGCSISGNFKAKCQVTLIF